MRVERWIPLSQRAGEHLASHRKARINEYVSPKTEGGLLPVMTTRMLLRRIKANLTALAFRSEFRDREFVELEFACEVA